MAVCTKTSIKALRNLEKIFEVKRTEQDDESFLECEYKEGGLQIDMPQIARGDFPGTTEVIVTLYIINTEFSKKV
ncbi:hypothetical protein ACJMK2_044306 [Sinanodonta woodiana]|uniref:Uncharacterized protein n=1 Tax=Sinanodonta woodiana TaxID=1069815 RepID=A0ABD3W310_SINWO